jgi:hypothetical protein
VLRNDLDSITVVDLEALVSSAVPEGVTLDDKESGLGPTPADSRESAADVASFANTLGGGGNRPHLTVTLHRIGSGPSGTGRSASGERQA